MPVAERSDGWYVRPAAASAPQVAFDQSIASREDAHHGRSSPGREQGLRIREGGRTAVTGRRGPRLIGLMLLTMAIFSSWRASSMAARPKTDEGIAVHDRKAPADRRRRPVFTTGDLTAELGQSVEYEIVVTNTSDSTLDFSELEDLNCTDVSPEGETELEAGESETFTCARTPQRTRPVGKLGEIEAEDEGKESESLLSNTVIRRSGRRTGIPGRKAPANQGLRQRLYDGLRSPGRPEKTVEYEIVVYQRRRQPAELLAARGRKLHRHLAFGLDRSGRGQQRDLHL